jgi:hypothetical protein
VRAFACGTCRSLVFFASSSCVTSRSLLNRIMGKDDLGRFVLPSRMPDTLRSVHNVMSAQR